MTRTAIYRHYATDGELLYVGVTNSPKRRLAEHSSRAEWFGQISRVEIIWHETRGEAESAEARAILAERPLNNRVNRRVGDPSVEVVDLRTWLLATGTTQAEFAQRIGVGQPFLSKLMNRKNMPSIDVAWAIECATGGEIPMQHWMESAASIESAA